MNNEGRPEQSNGSEQVSLAVANAASSTNRRGEQTSNETSATRRPVARQHQPRKARAPGSLPNSSSREVGTVRDTVHARLAALYQELSEEHGRLARSRADEYIDQHRSPLGRRLHCRLVRSGALEGYRAGRRVLAKQSAIDAYLQQHRVLPMEPAVGSEDEDDALLAAIGARGR